MPSSGSGQRHPLISLLLLVLLIAAGYIVFAVLSIFLVSVLFNKSLTAIAAGNMDAGVLRLVQGLTSAGAFILPPLILAATERKHNPGYLGNRKQVSPLLFILTIVIMFVASPFNEWVMKMNQLMHLPGFMHDIEIWMKNKEDLLAEMTKLLLTMHSVPELLINILVIALIPAIGEEFIFRGCLQTLFIRLTSNYHWGVWIAAIVFSAIHVQFFGFIPRMLLGVLFGYLFVWSRNIWIPVLAHFVNNCTAVVTAYIYQQQGKSLDNLDKPQDIPVYMIVASVILTGLLLYTFYTVSAKSRLADEEIGK